jgi:hypothetical protein
MVAVTTMTSREPAPNPEWVLMYRNGLPGRRIAELADVPVHTVSYHLRLARAADPELRPAHEESARTKKPAVTTRGLEQMHELVAMVQQTGRYPSRSAESTSERTLGVWLQRRRKEAWAGTLAPAFNEGLSVLSGWERNPRPVADEERWHEHLAALKSYRADGNDWPRHKAVVTGEEHELGVWLHTQRYKQRRGELAPRKQPPWIRPCRAGGSAGSADGRGSKTFPPICSVPAVGW